MHSNTSKCASRTLCKVLTLVSCQSSITITISGRPTVVTRFGPNTFSIYSKHSLSRDLGTNKPRYLCSYPFPTRASWSSISHAGVGNE